MNLYVLSEIDDGGDVTLGVFSSVEVAQSYLAGTTWEGSAEDGWYAEATFELTGTTPPYKVEFEITQYQLDPDLPSWWEGLV